MCYGVLFDAYLNNTEPNRHKTLKEVGGFQIY